MKIRSYQLKDQKSVISLWERCNLTRPWNDPQKDISRKLEVNPELFLVGTIGDKIVASIMVGYEGHRGWINYLAVDPDYQQKGYGRLLMEMAEYKLDELGCPKINLQIRKDNLQAIEFYKALGYLVDDTLSLGKRITHDN